MKRLWILFLLVVLSCVASCGPGQGEGEVCGEVVCQEPMICCNPLRSICVMPGYSCIQ